MTHYCFFREGTKYKTMLLQDFYKTRYFYNFLSDHIFLLLIMVEMKQQTSVVWIIWLQVCNKKLAYIKSINQHNWSTVNWKWKNQNNCCRGLEKKKKSHYQLWMMITNVIFLPLLSHAIYELLLWKHTLCSCPELPGYKQNANTGWIQTEVITEQLNPINANLVVIVGICTQNI